MSRVATFNKSVSEGLSAVKKECLLVAFAVDCVPLVEAIVDAATELVVLFVNAEVETMRTH